MELTLFYLYKVRKKSIGIQASIELNKSDDDSVERVFCSPCILSKYQKEYAKVNCLWLGFNNKPSDCVKIWSDILLLKCFLKVKYRMEDDLKPSPVVSQRRKYTINAGLLNMVLNILKVAGVIPLGTLNYFRWHYIFV